MSNDFYNTDGTPANQTRGIAASIRAVFDNIAAGFAKLPTLAQVWGGKSNFAVDTGVADAYLLSVAPTYITSLTDGLTVRMRALFTNTGASTLNLNSLGVKSIVRPNAAVLQAGDIVAGDVVELTYLAAPGQWLLTAAGTPVAPGGFSGTASGTVNLLTGTTIASASTVNLTAATGNRIHISGTTTITAVTLATGPRTVIFDGILTLTHHATNNNLPGAANITTAAGDRAVYESDGTTVYCVAYIRASGQVVAGVGSHEVVVHTGNGHGSTNNKIRRFTTTMTNVGTAITYADSAANGATFTINEAGLYSIHYSDSVTTAIAFAMGLSLNSAALTTSVASITVATRIAFSLAGTPGSGASQDVLAVTRTVRLVAGDVVRAHTSGVTDSTDNTVFLSIQKVGQ